MDSIFLTSGERKFASEFSFLEQDIIVITEIKRIIVLFIFIKIGLLKLIKIQVVLKYKKLVTLSF
jgi:hypothetical protein